MANVLHLAAGTFISAYLILLQLHEYIFCQTNVCAKYDTFTES